MLSKNEVLERYKELETTIDNRFGRRLANFLTVEELTGIGMKVKPEYKDDWVVEKEWKEENIIDQLVKDAEFGKMKAEDERGISSALMMEVCQSWLIVLEDSSINLDNYFGYGLEFFKKILKKYRGLKKE